MQQQQLRVTQQRGATQPAASFVRWERKGRWETGRGSIDTDNIYHHITVLAPQVTMACITFETTFISPGRLCHSGTQHRDEEKELSLKEFFMIEYLASFLQIMLFVKV